MQDFRQAIGSQAMPALQIILHFLRMHMREPIEVERLIKTASLALAAVDTHREWQPLVRRIVGGSAEAVEDLSRLLLPSTQGIDTVQRNDGTWAASIFHAGAEFRVEGAREVECALEALLAVTSHLSRHAGTRD